MAPPPVPFSYHLFQALMSTYPPSLRSPDMGTQIGGKLWLLWNLFIYISCHLDSLDSNICLPSWSLIMKRNHFSKEKDLPVVHSSDNFPTPSPNTCFMEAPPWLCISKQSTLEYLLAHFKGWTEMTRFPVRPVLSSLRLLRRLPSSPRKRKGLRSPSSCCKDPFSSHRRRDRVSFPPPHGETLFFL